MTDITVTSGSKVNGTSDIFSCRIWKFFQSAVQICLDPCLYLCFDLLSVSVQKLDSIIIKWIVACRDHDSTVKILCADNIRNTWSCRYMKKICICSGSGQSCCQCIFKHIAASSCILADHDLCFVLTTIVPAHITAYLKCMICCQLYVGFSTETICSKIFTHLMSLSLDPD